MKIGQESAHFRRNLMRAVVASAAVVPLLAQGNVAESGTFDALLKEGLALHQRADYQHSIPVLTAARKIFPHDYFANLLLGIDLLRNGKLDLAIAALEQASRQRPMEDFPYDYLAEAYAVQNHFADAAEAHAHAMRMAPASWQAVESSAEFWVERFRQLSARLRSTDKGLAAAYRLEAMSPAVSYETREELLQRAASLDPAAPGIWSDLAISDIAIEKPGDARTHTTRALEEDAGDLRAVEMEALLAAHDGNWKLTAVDLDRVGKASPGTLRGALAIWPRTLQPPPLFVITGAAAEFLQCAVQGNMECPALHGRAGLRTSSKSAAASREQLFREQRWEAVAALPEPKRMEPGGWLQRGGAFFQLGQCEKAIPSLERGLAMEQDEVYGSFALCWCYATEAGQAMALMQHTGEDEAAVHVIKGDVLFRVQGNAQAALPEYTAALRGHPDDPKVLERLAEAQFASGDVASAAQSARAALLIDPYRFSAIQTLASIAMEARRYEEAIPYLRKLSGHKQNDLRAEVELGVALGQTGQTADAIGHLAPPLARGYADEKGSLHAQLGAMLRKAGRTEEAAQAFAEARRLSEQYQQTPHRGDHEPKQLSQD